MDCRRFQRSHHPILRDREHNSRGDHVRFWGYSRKRFDAVWIKARDGREIHLCKKEVKDFPKLLEVLGKHMEIEDKRSGLGEMIYRGKPNPNPLRLIYKYSGLLMILLAILGILLALISDWSAKKVVTVTVFSTLIIAIGVMIIWNSWKYRPIKIYTGGFAPPQIDFMDLMLGKEFIKYSEISEIEEVFLLTELVGDIRERSVRKRLDIKKADGKVYRIEDRAVEDLDEVIRMITEHANIETKKRKIVGNP